MSTLTVSNIGNNTTTGVIQPSFKVSLQALLHDFWDGTHQRYTSGVVVTSITSISWSGGTLKTGETATVTIGPTNYQENANDQLILSPVISSGSPISPSFTHRTAINYGMPDGSAVLNPDGTISLVDIEFDLNANAFTPIGSYITVTITYTSVFTEYSPYASIGGSPTASPLAIGNGSAADWGMINQDSSDPTIHVFVVQLSSLAWSVLPGSAPIGIVPTFQLSNPARPGGRVVANYSTPLAPTYGRTLNFFDYYTYVFVVNDGKVDANATPLQVGGESEAYNLCNFGLTAPDASGTDTVTATLTYYVATH